jgi:hypothetical protein
MKLNNRNISNQFRVLHRYLGFFLSGIMFMYALTGITLTYRDKDTFKTEVVIERQIEKGLASAPEIRGVKKPRIQCGNRRFEIHSNATSKIFGHDGKNAQSHFIYSIIFPKYFVWCGSSLFRRFCLLDVSSSNRCL